MAAKLKFDDKMAKQLRKEYEAGATLRELAKKYDSNPVTVRDTIDRVGGKMRSKKEAQKTAVPREEWPKIVQMYKDGGTIRQIGRVYKTSFHNIHYYLDQSNVTLRNRDYSTMGKKGGEIKAHARYERNMKWRKKYESGMTLQQIVDEEEERTYVGTVSRAIQRVGGTMRPTGYPKGEKDKNKPKRGLLSWLDS